MFRLSRSKNLNLAKVYDSAHTIAENFSLIKKVRRRRHFITVLKTVSITVLVLGFLVLMIFAAHFMAIKSAVGMTWSGKSAVERAIALARAGDYKNAQIESNAASEHFSSAVQSLEQINKSPIISRLSPLSFQVEQVNYLVSSAAMLSRAVYQATSFGLELQNLLDGNRQLNYSTFSKEEKKRVLGRISTAAPELVGLKANLDLALINLDNIVYPGPLWPFKGKIDDIKSKVSDASFLLSRLAPMSQILPALAGYPATSTYLVMFQNSDELRPTGGFLGTYGILETESGDINRFETHDIYHIDMPVKDKVKVEPPVPLKKYLNEWWYMRDANWSPDWPTSAQKLQWFYDLENPLLPPKDQVNNFTGKFDGVIAITPRLVTDLLSIVGPIVIDGQEYNENNFIELLQYRVEKGYEQLGIPSWQRKEVIGSILREMKIRLFNLPASDWRRVVSIFDGSIEAKNLLIYMRDPSLQTLVSEQDWSGEVKKTDGDYLMVVDANLASLKTDAVMSRSINYEVNDTGDALNSHLVVNYAHRGQPDWKTSYYQTYTRIYVPQGSHLIKMEGCQSDVDIYEELGKTVFGCRFMVSFNSIGTLNLEYRLPERLKSGMTGVGYKLYVQKQPGNQVGELTFDFNSQSVIKSYSPVGFSVDWFTGKRIGWASDLSFDRQFSVSF